MMRTASHGVSFQSPLSKEDDHLVGFAFVDDTDIVEGTLQQVDLTIEDIMTRMQEAVNRWEGGLKATGGAIRPDKSFIYPIDFKFNTSGKCEFKTLDEIPYEISVKDEYEQRHILDNIPSTVGKETLGVYLAPNGNCKDAIKKLRDKAIAWKQHITTGHLPPKEAWQCVGSTITKALEYPLLAMTLTEKECARIMLPVKDAGLAESGVCRKYPLDLVYGSTELMGLGMTDLFVSQGISHVDIIQEYIHSTCMTGSLLRAAIEWAKIHVGVEGNFFQLDFKRYGNLLPRSFVKTAWEFARKYHIDLPNTDPNLIPHREQDQFLMEAFAAQPSITNSQLTELNRCRLFLQVHTLSDIVDGSGTRLSKQYFDGTIDQYRTPSHDWPKQGNPGTSQWALWRKSLKKCFPLSPENTLLTPLGSWNVL